MATTTGEEAHRRARAERRLRGLAAALASEGQAIGGQGEVLVRIRYRGGDPASMEVVERHPVYLLGQEQPRVIDRPVVAE